MDKKQMLKKTGSILLNVIMYVFLIVALFAVIMSISAKKGEDGTATMFGHQLRFVQSDSMGKSQHTDVSKYKIKSIPVKSLIFVEVKPESGAAEDAWYDSLKVGDVLTFRYKYVKQETITHRITEIEELESGYKITLKGDNKTTENSNVIEQVIYTDPTEADDPDGARFNYVIGKVVGQSYPLGLLIGVLKGPVGIVFIVILPSLLIIVFEVIKIVRVFGEEKRKKAENEKQQQKDTISAQASELEELKKRLAELEQGKETSNEGSAEAGGQDLAEEQQNSVDEKSVETSETTTENNNSEGEGN